MAQDSDIFEVDKILGRKLIRGKPVYLIRWKSFGPEEDTWEPLLNLSACMKMVAAFEENNKDLEKIPKGSDTTSKNKKYGKLAMKLVKKSKEGVSRKGHSKDGARTNMKKSVNTTAKDKQGLKSKGGKDKLKLSIGSNNKRKHSSLESGSANLESDASDDDILYSLNDDPEISLGKISGEDIKAAELKAELKKEKRQLKKLKLDIKKADIPGCMSSSMKQGHQGNHKQKIRMIDSMKSKVFQPVQRPVSPMTGFTTVKSMSASSGMCSGMMHASPNPARPANVMDSYFGDVPAASVVPMIPSSPSAISYKTLLDNLPHQLHPKKAPKKEEPENDDDDDDVEIIERRQSVRASECAFRYKDIVVKKCPGYTQIWLFSNTKQKNALNPQVIQEIISAMSYAKYDDSRLVMFSGLGNMFCSGVDLHFLLSEDRKVAARKMVDAIRDLTKTFLTFPKPVVAVVNGPAIGLGVGLLPLCDVVYASDKASCYLPYGRLGQTPESCLSFTLPHLIGFPMANELLFAGRKITAIEAYQLGLVSQVFWPTSMMQDVIPRVQNMAMNSAKAQEATKLLIRSHQRTKLELTSETECNLLYDRWTSSECHRYILSYLEDEKNLVL